MRRTIPAGLMIAAFAALAILSGPATRAAAPPVAGAPAAAPAPVAASTTTAAPAATSAPVELEPFAFLIGEWPASGTGQPGAGTGTATFTRGVQDKVIVRASYADYPAAAGKPASRHDDLMVIYAAPGGGARADYYDSEGHVIHYVVQSTAPGQAVFLSDAAAGGGPRFRLAYTLASPGVLKGEFAIAPPGTPETFKPYLTWESHKKTEGAK
jgi:hypothetical protein